MQRIATGAVNTMLFPFGRIRVEIRQFELGLGCPGVLILIGLHNEAEPSTVRAMPELIVPFAVR